MLRNIIYAILAIVVIVVILVVLGVIELGGEVAESVDEPEIDAGQVVDDGAAVDAD